MKHWSMRAMLASAGLVVGVTIDEAIRGERVDMRPVVVVVFTFALLALCVRGIQQARTMGAARLWLWAYILPAAAASALMIWAMAASR